MSGWNISEQDLKRSEFVCEDVLELKNKLMKSYYEELEVTVCSMIAAGVPLPKIKISKPKLDLNMETCTVGLVSEIKFL